MGFVSLFVLDAWFEKVDLAAVCIVVSAHPKIFAVTIESYIGSIAFGSRVYMILGLAVPGTRFLRVLGTSTQVDLNGAVESGIRGILEPWPTKAVVDRCHGFLGMWGEQIYIDALAN